jgi:hypothetical protein
VNFEPVLEKVPSLQRLEPVKAPVEKLTVPKAEPFADEMPLKRTSSEPVDTTPASVYVIVPLWLVKSIAPAQAATGSNSIISPNMIVTRFIDSLHKIYATLLDNPWGSHRDH